MSRRIAQAEAAFLASIDVQPGTNDADRALHYYRGSFEYQWLQLEDQIDRLWIPMRWWMRLRILRSQRRLAALRDAAIERYFRDG